MTSKLSSVSFVNGKLELSRGDFESLDGMLRMVAAKYHGWYEYTFDDIYEVCWEKAMESIKNGHYDLSWICKCCYNSISDVMRAKRRESIRGFSCDFDDIAAYLDGEIEEPDPITEKKACKIPKVDPSFNDQYQMGNVFMDSEFVHEILSLFDKGSQEWQYLMLVAIRVGSIEVNYSVFEKLFPCEHTSEYEIARLMGFKNQSYSKYRKIRIKVRKKVAEYLGFNLYK